jgi:hypothetical protein
MTSIVFSYFASIKINKYQQKKINDDILKHKILNINDDEYMIFFC